MGSKDASLEVGQWHTGCPDWGSRLPGVNHGSHLLAEGFEGKLPNL